MKSDKIFKVDDISTYPDGLTEIFSEYYDVIRSYFRDAKIEDYYDVHCILEVNEFWNNPKLAELKDRALAFLEDWKIRAYHNTRIRDIEEVTTQGLLLLDPENYTHKMRELLNASPFSSETEELLRLVEPYLKNAHGHRTGLIAFFAPGYLSNEYDKFVGNVGGEVAEFAFYDRPDVLAYLAAMGMPVTVEFGITVSKIVSYRHETIVAELVRKHFCDTQLNMNYKIGFDAATELPVVPEDILQVIVIDEMSDVSLCSGRGAMPQRESVMFEEVKIVAIIA